MKFIVIHGKKLGIVMVIVGLMVVLAGLEITFDSRLKSTALIHENIKNLQEYFIQDKPISYKLPDMWTTKTQSFLGGEIEYHNEFISEDCIIHGFVEFWNYKKDLKQFLDESKVISDKQNINNDYVIKDIKVNKYDGYLVTYTRVDDKNNEYYAYEYFIKKTDGFVRFSFFVRQSNFKTNMPFIFEGLVNTLNTNKINQNKYNYEQ